jgi:hypothetical protein
MIHTNKRKSKDAVQVWWKPSKEFGDIVSVGLKNFFGTSEKRFWDSVTKQIDGCWFCSKKTIMENGIEYQSKIYSAKLHNLNFTKECIIQTCKNSKCVNPAHLSEIDRIEQAKSMVNNRPKLSRDNGYGKLSNDDIFNIKNLYKETFSKNGGKHRGIANQIHKKYPNVTLATIVGIIKEIKPKYLIDETPILMYEYNDNTNNKGKFIKQYPNIESAKFDKEREVKSLEKRYIIEILEGKRDRTGHGKSRRGGYVFEYENN